MNIEEKAKDYIESIYSVEIPYFAAKEITKAFVAGATCAASAISQDNNVMFEIRDQSLTYAHRLVREEQERLKGVSRS
jgi:hypothetical protein